MHPPEDLPETCRTPCASWIRGAYPAPALSTKLGFEDEDKTLQYKIQGIGWRRCPFHCVQGSSHALSFAPARSSAATAHSPPWPFY